MVYKELWFFTALGYKILRMKFINETRQRDCTKCMLDCVGKPPRRKRILRLVLETLQQKRIGASGAVVARLLCMLKV
jgi:hypothetical protein